MVSARTGTVLLKLEDVQQWQSQLEDLQRERARIDQDIAQLREKIDAARIFMPKGDKLVQTDQADSGGYSHEQDESLPDAIVRVLREIGHPATHKEIKKSLMKSDLQAKRLADNAAYYYTAMKRLRDRGVIAESNGRHYLAKEKGPDDESSEPSRDNGPGTGVRSGASYPMPEGSIPSRSSQDSEGSASAAGEGSSSPSSRRPRRKLRLGDKNPAS